MDRTDIDSWLYNTNSTCLVNLESGFACENDFMELLFT